MAIPKLKRDTYLAWLRDMQRLRQPEPTTAEALAADRMNVIDVMPTHQGCLIRLGTMSGGSLDLMLNAAQAVHLFRYLAVAGVTGGWMDREGSPLTDPPITRDEHIAPKPHDL